MHLCSVPVLVVGGAFLVLSLQMAAVESNHNERDEIKEYHFHVYFFQSNEQSKNSALKLRENIQSQNDAGFFVAIPYTRINYEPRGPHTIGSYEVWCPKEHYSRAYSWFLLNRGELSILIHPLTKEEVKDHTVRAAWMGDPVPLDVSKLADMLPSVPLQYPELGLGYSARN